MKIEIAVPERMSQSGSSLLRLLQNNDMPKLDLLVRESIQNSLDAKDESKDYVSVEFITGEFKSNELSKELDQITSSLDDIYNDNVQKYVAIKDFDTVGLTGKLHFDEVDDNNYGNLLKLIYEISKAQDAEGAGGSWGLGKTVYFRIGIGLVLYYSRIKTVTGEFESRLAASLVENELQEKSLIPKLEGKSKRGIAWWGEEIGSNKTRPVIDEIYINKLLQIFGIQPYRDEQTGTTIIIPYIDEKALLSSNQIEYKSGDDIEVQPFWRNSLEEYLKVSIQRWYAPRLNNIYYPYGKFLRVYINGEGLSNDEMEPSFQIIQSLYIKAINAQPMNTILENPSIKTKVEQIKLRNVLAESCSGTIAYTKVPREVLRTNYPDNKPEPCMYFNCEALDYEKNKPFITFVRRPAMIVSYENVGKWVDRISATDKNEFIIGVFVLNSNNILLHSNAKQMSLEEYVRKSEMADHTSWSDYSLRNVNPLIISKIQGNVNNKISKEFYSEEENLNKRNSGLSKMFGDLLLPPDNFGKKPGSEPDETPKKTVEIHKNIRFSYDVNDIQYTRNMMSIRMNLNTKKPINSTGILLSIDSESGSISAEVWEQKLGLTMPFEIVEAKMHILNINENVYSRILSVNESNSRCKYEGISLLLMQTEKQAGYEVKVYSDELVNLNLEFELSIKLNRRDLKPIFTVDKNEGEL